MYWGGKMKKNIYLKFHISCLEYDISFFTNDNNVKKLLMIMLSPYLLISNNSEIIKKSLVIEIQCLNKDEYCVIIDNNKRICNKKVLNIVLQEVIFVNCKLKKDYIFLHASMVEREGKIVFLAGETGSGKSTLCTFLCNKGFNYLCDDKVILNTKNFRVFPFTREIQLRHDALNFLLEKGIVLNAKEINIYSYSRLVTNNFILSKKDRLSIGIFINLNFSMEKITKINKIEAIDVLLKSIYINNDIDNIIKNSIALSKNIPLYKIDFNDLENCKNMIIELLMLPEKVND